MLINITGKNITLTPALKTHTTDKLQALVDLGHEIHKTHVILSVEHLAHIAEATITFKGGEMHAKASEDDMYKAIDVMTNKLEKQLIKHKEKLIDEHR